MIYLQYLHIDIIITYVEQKDFFCSSFKSLTTKSTTNTLFITVWTICPLKKKNSKLITNYR